MYLLHRLIFLSIEMNIAGSFAALFRIDFFQNYRLRRTTTRVAAALRANILFDRRVISIIVGGVVLAVVVKNFHRSAPTHPNMPQPSVISSIPVPETFAKAARTLSSGISASYQCIQRHSVSIFTSIPTFTA